MMAGNPNWWSINTMHPQSRQLPSGYHESFPQYLYGSSPNLADHNHDPGQEYPRSWSQLLIGGLANDDPEETLLTGSPNYEIKKVEQNWEGQNLNPCLTGVNDYGSGDDVKLENSLIYGGGVVDEFQVVKPCWSQVIMPASSPSSSVTCLSSNLLNFSTTTSKFENRNHHPETSSECNSSKAASVAKKPKIQHSTTQTSLKVRKEKLGDRITSLHQLVSPFGKTDTASVLSESVGYIRFLQAQIQALSSPYLGNIASRSNDSEDKPKDLKSRGLCLVPVSCTIHVASDNGADYWAPPPPPPGRGF